MELLKLEANSSIYSRSIPRQFVVVDEAQNLTPHKVKTIMARVGEGTMIVLNSDPYRNDNPYMDADSNGLAWLVEGFKGQALADHVTLMTCKHLELAANLS